MSKSKFTVCVEGNVGCGKSTFIHHFRNSLPGLHVLEEPVPQWTNLKGHNLLGMMYSDTSRWSALFQSYVMLTLSQGHADSLKEESRVILFERSLHSAVRIFVENLRIQGGIAPMDYHILQEWYTMMSAEQTYDLDVIIYLRARPQVCLDRVRKRDRPEEANLSIEFVQQLHELHEQWLIEHKFGCPSTRVLVVDAEQDLEQLTQAYDADIMPLLAEFCGQAPADGRPPNVEELSRKLSQLPLLNSSVV